MTSNPFARRRALAAIVLGFAASAAAAQAWPSKPISLIVPFPAGGSSDVLARALGDKLGQSLGQPVIVESRPGAGATLGADYAAKSKPDGYTLLMGAVHHTIATSVYRKLPYDFEKSFAPITTIAMVPNVLVVNSNAAPTDVKSLVALAKASPGKLSYGSNGNGTVQHLIGTQFSSLTGVELLHVPYKGSAPLTTDLLGGQVDMSFDTLTPLVQHIKAGKLRALAVTTAKRSSTLPDVPTLAEAGMKDFNQGTWFGILAPAATPKELAYGSNGNGTAQHLIGTQFQASTGVKLLHVPYKGSGPLTTDLLGGQVDMSFDTITPVLQHIKGGKLRALAVTTAKRSAVLPEVPTLEEAGLKGFDIGTWFGVLAPAGTPKDITTKLHTEMARIIKSPEFAERMRAIGADPIGDSSAEMAARIREETAKFARLVKEGKVAVE